MKKHINFLLVLAAIAALVVTAVALRGWSASAKTNKDALTVMLEKNAAMKARVDALKPKTAAGSATGKTAKAATESMTTAERLAKARAQALAREARIANDREFGLKYYAAMRSDIDAQYGAFYRLRQLTSEQGEALAEALFQRQLRYDKLASDWRISISAGTKAARDAADAVVKTGKDAADAEFATAAQAAIGGAAYEQLQLYERQGAAWGYVINYGGMMSLADIPLSVEQASQLAAAIAGASTSWQKGQAVDMRTVDWGAVDAAAAEFLTPEQLDFFKNVEVVGLGALVNPISRQDQELRNALNKL